MNTLYKNLLLLTAFCFFLLMVRIKLSGENSFTFLLWNLFLAAIPFFISQYLTVRKRKYSKYLLSGFLAIWILFLPNAPYIVTDFIHLKYYSSDFFWLDLLMIFSFSLAGLVFGITSMRQMLQIIQQRWSPKISDTVLILACLGCGFGIYLGRVLRFNSWDILSSPLAILKRSILSYTDATAWLMTLGFSCLFYIVVKLYSLPST